MLKRTTVYLEESEVEILKKISFIQSVSMAELIRGKVQELCKSFSNEQKEALALLAEIKEDAKRRRISERRALQSALIDQREVRSARKTSRR